MPQRVDIDIPFLAGLEQATSDDARDPTQGFTALENTVQRKRAAYSKRTGYASVAAHPSATPLVAMASHRDDALIAHDAAALYAYSETGNTWSTRGRIPSLTVDRSGISSSGVFRGTTVYDVGAASGYLVVVYEAARALFSVVLDAETRAPVLGPTKLSDGLSGADALQEFRATVVMVGAVAVCVYNREDVVGLTREDAVKFRTLDTTDLGAGWTAAADLIGAGSIDLTVGTYLFDAHGLSDRFALLWRTLAGDVELTTYDTAGTQIDTVTAFSGAAGTATAWSVAGDDTTLWLTRSRSGSSAVGAEAYVTSGLVLAGTYLATAFPSLLTGSESSDNGVTASCVVTGSGTAQIVVTGRCTSFGDYDRFWVGWRPLAISGGAVVTSGDASAAQHLELTHKPWLQGDRVLAVVVPWNTFDPPLTSAPVELAAATNRERCMWVVDVTDPRLGDVHPMATIAPRLVAERGMLYLPRYLRQPPAAYGTTRALVVPTLRSGQSESLDLVRLTPTSYGTHAELAGLVHSSGGVAWSYDGSEPFEVAYMQTPRAKATSSVAGALTGTFLYVATWEHVDAAGNVHASEPSAPISVTLAAESSRIRITTPTVTFRDDRSTGADRVRAVLFRTTAGGGTYYRCAEAWVYEAASSSGGAFVQITDNMADATLQQRARLYTQPGALGTSLPRRSPPSLRYVVQHGDTLAGIGEDRRTIWFSAPLVGGEGPWFQDLFVVEVNDVSPLVALASFDGRLWAFTRSGVHVIDGSGFLENGSGGYNLPQRVPVDVGCVEPRSVVVTPQGAMFLSELGIAMLSRSSQVTFFGEAVAATTAAYPVCTGAVLEPSETHVVFAMRTADGSAGVHLAYDYVTGIWTTEQLSTAALATVGGVLYRTSGTATRRRAAGTYLDASSWVGQVVETGWLKIGGVPGAQRIKRVVLRYHTRSSAGLRVSMGYDYGTAYEDVREWDASELPAATIEIAPARQRCTAFRVRVEELAPASAELGTGQGLDFTAIRIVASQRRRPGFSAAEKD